MRLPANNSIFGVIVRLAAYVAVVAGACFVLVFVFQRYYISFAQDLFGTKQVYGLVGGVQTLNPLFTRRGSTEEALSRNLFRGLVTYDEGGNLIGDLAESWELRENAKEILVTLRPDLYWSDGVKITANDVLFTYQLTQQVTYDGVADGLFDGVDIQVVSDSVLLFILPNTYIPFLDTLRTPVLPLHIFGSSDPGVVREQLFLRNGPFSTNVQGISTRLSKLNGTDLVQSIEIRTEDRDIAINMYERPDTLKTAFQLGDVHTVLALQQMTSELFVQNDHLEYVELPVVGQQIALMLNTSSITDINDRKAILQAIDNEFLSGSAFVGPYAEQSLFWDKQESLRVALDTEQAKRQLRDRTFSLVTLDTPELLQIAEQIVGYLSEADIVTTIYPNTLKEFNETTAPERKYDMVLMPLEIGREPDVYSFWHSSQVDHPGLNFGKVVSRRVDNALEKGRVNASFENRKQLYTEFQQNLLELHTVEFIGHPKLTLVSYQNSTVFGKEYIWDYTEFWAEIFNNS